MKIYLIGAAAFVAGFGVCKMIYTEKALRAYDMGWRECKADIEEQEERQARLAAKFPDSKIMEAAKTESEPEEPPAEEGDAEDEITIETAQELVQRVGYDQFGKKNKDKKPKINKQLVSLTTSTLDENEPKIISQEEFFDRGLEVQYQITYYAGDDTLVGQSGNVIEGDARVTGIGKDALSQFGVNSNDPNVVYVRNFLMNRGKGVDFEITREWGNYSDEKVEEVVPAE